MSIPYGVGAGPGNLNPVKSFLKFKAGASITKGNLVSISTSADDGYTVVVTDGDAVTTCVPIGVAAETAASGAWFDVQVGGFCDYMTAATSVVAGDLLISGTLAGTAYGVDLTDLATSAALHATIFGQALADDDSGVLRAALIFNKF